MSDFYRYIYESNGGYSIKKDNIHYGWYDDIRWALHDRDMLELCDWDLGEFVYIEKDNQYLHMRLPPKGLNRWRQYIYIKRNGYVIQKTINGKLEYFGYYNTLNEALDRRDELISNNWEE